MNTHDCEKAREHRNRIIEEWTGRNPATELRSALEAALERERKAIARRNRLALIWKAVKRALRGM